MAFKYNLICFSSPFLVSFKENFNERSFASVGTNRTFRYLRRRNHANTCILHKLYIKHIVTCIFVLKINFSDSFWEKEERGFKQFYEYTLGNKKKKMVRDICFLLNLPANPYNLSLSCTMLNSIYKH